MGADVVEIGKTIHPHPTLGESIGMAAEVTHVSGTDLPPVRKSTTASRPPHGARTGNGSGFVLCVADKLPHLLAQCVGPAIDFKRVVRAPPDAGCCA